MPRTIEERQNIGFILDFWKKIVAKHKELAPGGPFKPDILPLLKKYDDAMKRTGQSLPVWDKVHALPGALNKLIVQHRDKRHAARAEVDAIRKRFEDNWAKLAMIGSSQADGMDHERYARELLHAADLSAERASGTAALFQQIVKIDAQENEQFRSYATQYEAGVKAAKAIEAKMEAELNGLEKQIHAVILAYQKIATQMSRHDIGEALLDVMDRV